MGIEINGLIGSTVVMFLSTPATPHLLVVAGAALASSALNVCLKRKGHTFLMGFVNKVLWIAAGVLTMDAFFNVGHAAEVLFGL